MIHFRFAASVVDSKLLSHAWCRLPCALPQHSCRYVVFSGSGRPLQRSFSPIATSTPLATINKTTASCFSMIQSSLIRNIAVFPLSRFKGDRMEHRLGSHLWSANNSIDVDVSMCQTDDTPNALTAWASRPPISKDQEAFHNSHTSDSHYINFYAVEMLIKYICLRTTAIYWINENQHNNNCSITVYSIVDSTQYLT